MTTRADIANETNRKLYQNHLASMAKLREARLRIEQLEAALRRIVAMTPDPEFGAFPIESAIDVARAALERKD